MKTVCWCLATVTKTLLDFCALKAVIFLHLAGLTCHQNGSYKGQTANFWKDLILNQKSKFIFVEASPAALQPRCITRELEQKIFHRHNRSSKFFQFLTRWNEFISYNSERKVPCLLTLQQCFPNACKGQDFEHGEEPETSLNFALPDPPYNNWHVPDEKTPTTTFLVVPIWEPCQSFVVRRFSL